MGCLLVQRWSSIAAIFLQGVYVLPWKPKILLPRSLVRETISRASPGQLFSGPCLGYRNMGFFPSFPPPPSFHIPLRGPSRSSDWQPMCKRDRDLVGFSRVQTHGLSLRLRLSQTRAFSNSPGLCRCKGGCWGGHRIPTLEDCKLAPSGCRPSGQATATTPLFSVPFLSAWALHAWQLPSPHWWKALMESALRTNTGWSLWAALPRLALPTRSLRGVFRGIVPRG